jgi:hypothetical protein
MDIKNQDSIYFRPPGRLERTIDCFDRGLYALACLFQGRKKREDYLFSLSSQEGRVCIDILCDIRSEGNGAKFETFLKGILENESGNSRREVVLNIPKGYSIGSSTLASLVKLAQKYSEIDIQVVNQNDDFSAHQGISHYSSLSPRLPNLVIS